MLHMLITLERQRLTKLCFDQAKPLLDAKLVKEMVDPRLGANYDLAKMKCCMATTSLCIHHMSCKRPYMDQVSQRLRNLPSEEVVNTIDEVEKKEMASVNDWLHLNSEFEAGKDKGIRDCKVKKDCENGEGFGGGEGKETRDCKVTKGYENGEIETRRLKMKKSRGEDEYGNSIEDERRRDGDGSDFVRWCLYGGECLGLRKSTFEVASSQTTNRFILDGSRLLGWRQIELRLVLCNFGWQ
ncbi:Receptor-like cytosolic serine/threonine-protein [Vigna angularis]|uniref:Receptor-like cytosolic serine/threonine-protein n=1 Tax=Phaseolus angularis TaxID=3914 RepID=A0A8T0K6H9_PHAAN|nr:Receptor-like cytosolic serine/threonine-protein [Vigna angularis]